MQDTSGEIVVQDTRMRGNNKRNKPEKVVLKKQIAKSICDQKKIIFPSKLGLYRPIRKTRRAGIGEKEESATINIEIDINLHISLPFSYSQCFLPLKTKMARECRLSVMKSKELLRKCSLICRSAHLSVHSSCQYET